MSEGTPKAIELKGIVRNATKIGVQDGQAEDLINLRFMDGSWRASGDGRLVHTMSGTIYQQLYVHTNVYHHLLGVDNGTLYWFAEIDNDGATFYPLDGTSDRSQWPDDKQDLPTERKPLTTVTGSMWITQNGHLLTIIDESDDFEYFVFKTSTKEYIEVNMDVNGKATDRSLYPFWQVHFNLYEPFQTNIDSGDHAVVIETENVKLKESDDTWKVELGVPISDAQTAFGKAQKKNMFVNPFLVLSALRLYDGSYMYATNPVLLYPRQPSSSGRRFFDTTLQDYRYFSDLDNKRTAVGINYNTVDGKKYFHKIAYCDNETTASGGTFHTYPEDTIYPWENQNPFRDDLPSFMCGLHMTSMQMDNNHNWLTVVLGSDLVCSITEDLLLIMQSNKDIFQAFCIFVTPEINPYKLNNEETIPYKVSTAGNKSLLDGSPVFFKRKPDSQIQRELLNQPFFLLKEYKNVNDLLSNPIVDLSDKEELLANLIQQDTLPTEALSRTTYLPKVSYMYNGRLHIANYKSHPFFGYPIDLFHLHNHSVKVQDGAWFKGVLPNLADNNDDYLQYEKAQYKFFESGAWGAGAGAYAWLTKGRNLVYAYIKVLIDSSQGEQTVVRYIEPYSTFTPVNGRADFIEKLNPLLTYPDARAKKMQVYIMSAVTENGGEVESWYKEFDLKPHPYLNIAYYIDPQLQPIGLLHEDVSVIDFVDSDFDTYADAEHPKRPTKVPQMVNIEEYFPNGLKVSKTDQPMFFPVENTYQVGSAEILALMSNTIAVGTGQTGDAPLYVFCKDGVYALYVDSSGQMAYPNARILARDVCNNPRSVTPIDAGVVFTTDRGLMMIAGEQVQEIGAPAEGDVVQFWNAGSVDYSKIATASMQQIAGLPSNLCSTTDFLTYLQDKGEIGTAAIINYNHNMRELMVSNPNYPYSYVLDRDGNWSRRDYTAAQYVNNYPTSYRVDADGHFYKVDDEGDAGTSLEHRKEADNKIFYLSNVIKLDSIGFKQAYRFVVRGYFETLDNANIACVVEGSYDGRKFKPLGYNRKSGKFRDIGCIVERTDVRFFRVCLSGHVTGKTRIDYMEMSAGASMLNTKIR